MKPESSSDKRVEVFFMHSLKAEYVLSFVCVFKLGELILSLSLFFIYFFFKGWQLMVV